MSVIRVVGFALFVAFVTWGVVRVPGRPFSWTMFTGSSKPFLWVGDARASRAGGTEELGLAPDAHYLLPGDLETLVRRDHGGPVRRAHSRYPGKLERGLQPLRRAHHDAPSARPDDDLRALAEALRRHEWT